MRFWIGACALIWVVSVSATPENSPESSLTLGLAIALVLENNPQLQAADFDTRAAAERIRQSSQATPWELSLELENLAGTGQASGVGDMQTTLSLGRVLELGEKPRLRGEAAQLEARVLRHEQDARRLDLLAETARRFLDIVRMQDERKLGRELVALTQRTLATVEKRFRIGKAPAAERSRAQIDLARAELALEETDHLLANRRLQLSVLWGEVRPRFGTAEADLFHMDAVPDYAVLEQLIDRNPTLVRLATDARLNDARLQLARARSRADVDVRGGMRHFNAGDDVGLVLSVSMPLGSVSRARSYIDERANQVKSQSFLAQEQRLALQAALFEFHLELLHARDRLTAYEERIVPAAEKALSDYSQGYAAGRYSLLELTSMQEILLEARKEILSAATDYHRIRIEIDRLTGGATNSGVSR